ncbi:metalloproteinase inhibitor 2-like isoform X4, partial [Leptotrombidium deliense]
MRKLLCVLIALQVSTTAVLCCVCIKLTKLQHFCSSDITAVVKVTGSLSLTNTRLYSIQVKEVFKTTSNITDVATLSTNLSPEFCGVSLDANNSTYFITALMERSPTEKPFLLLSSCNFFTRWDTA